MHWEQDRGRIEGHTRKAWKTKISQASYDNDIKSKIDVYRPDVDGLRALAVVLVVLNHAHLGFSGGFVGVDVFFVISGYLITNLILREQAAGTYRLSRFWSRRVRRIVPASAVMSVVVLAMGAWLFLPDDYSNLGKSALAHQFMLSNVYFYRTLGYFARPADFKPLLHTWSLAVEEQFYLLYPLCLMVLVSKKKLSVMVLSGAALVSLGVSEWAVWHAPRAGFYLLHTRFWELLLGGLINYLPRYGKPWRWSMECLSVLGIGAIGVAAVGYDSSIRFPGLAALFPCLGAACLIHSNQHRLTVVGRLMALGPVVWVGRISYSLYLWHWPILAFSRYWLGSALSPTMTSACLAASLGVSWVSWRFIEVPFRRSRPPAQQRLILIGLTLTAPMIIIFSLLVFVNDGFPNRLTQEALKVSEYRKIDIFTRNVRLTDARQGLFPKIGDPNGKLRCLVWGDSHAMAYLSGIDAACRALGIQGAQATHNSTPPLLDFVYSDSNSLLHEAPEYGQVIVDYIKNNNIDMVFIAATWASYATLPNFERQLGATISAIQRNGANVFVILDVAKQKVDIPTTIMMRATKGQSVGNDLSLPFRDYLLENQACNAIIQRVAQGKATILDPAPFFVENGHWRVLINGHVMYRDHRHLSTAGGLYLQPLFQNALEKQIQNHH